MHEAHELEDDAELAHRFGHSTASEAGEAALAARVRRLVLTHLRASRLVDLAQLATEAKAAFGGPVEVARDLDTFDF